MDYLSTTQMAKVWDISVQRVRLLCKEGRVEGATKVGGSYMIPASAPKPPDARRSGATAKPQGVTITPMDSQTAARPVPIQYSLFDSLPVGGVVFTRRDGEVTMRFNARMHDLLKLPYDIADEVPLDEFEQMLLPHDREVFQAALADSFDNNLFSSVEFRVWSRRDRCYFWLNMRTNPAFTWRGADRLFSAMIDVNGTHKIMSDLKQSSRHLNEVESGLGIYSFEHDVRTGITLWGSEAKRDFGFDDATTHTFPGSVMRPDILHPDYYDLVADAFDDVANGRLPNADVLVRGINPSTSDDYVLRRVRFVGHKDEKGVVARVTSTSQDVGVVYRLEASYAESATLNGVHVWDYDCSAHTGRLHHEGRQSHTFAQPHMFDHGRVHPDFLADLVACEHKAQQAAGSVSIEVPLKSSEGVYEWALLGMVGIVSLSSPTHVHVLCTVKPLDRPYEG